MRSGVKKRADDAHAEDHEHEQHQHLRRLEDEELDRRAQVRAGLETDESVRQPVRERLQLPVDGDPDDESGACQGQIRVRDGYRRAVVL